MKSRAYSLVRTAAIAGVALFVLGLIAGAAGMRINTSRSIPLGVYWAVADPVRKGAYVTLCPPALEVMAEARRRGYLQGGTCPGGYGYLMKKVVATSNDAVAISSEGVRVNGTLLPLSAPLSRDPSGRQLRRFQLNEFIIGGHQLLLMSDVSATSFDGRYFGPIDRDQVKSVIVPVLTW